jgi:hypothetical protein
VAFVERGVVRAVGLDLVDVEIRAGEAVTGRDRAGEFDFVAGLLVADLVGNRGFRLADGHDLGAIRGGTIPPGAEEPQPVANQEAADGGFVNGVDVVFALVGQWRFILPRVVGEIGAERARELVAAVLGHHVDETAGEAAVLGGYAAGHDRGLLDGVLDEHVEGLAAEVLVEDHAVEGVEVLVRHGARDGGVAAGAGGRGTA